MKVLNKIYKHKGYSYQQVWRDSNYAIYRQINTSLYPKKVVGFEVFKITLQKERTFNGRTFEGGEKYPSPSNFGKTAWSVDTLAKAKVFVSELKFYGKVLKSDVRRKMMKYRIYLQSTSLKAA